MAFFEIFAELRSYTSGSSGWFALNFIISGWFCYAAMWNFVCYNRIGSAETNEIIIIIIQSNSCYLNMSFQSGCSPARTGRRACSIHGSSKTHAFGPNSSIIRFSASGMSMVWAVDSALLTRCECEWNDDERRILAWYVSVR